MKIKANWSWNGFGGEDDVMSALVYACLPPELHAVEDEKARIARQVKKRLDAAGFEFEQTKGWQHSTVDVDAGEYGITQTLSHEADMREAAKIPGVNIPETESFEEFSANPHFPVLAKLKALALTNPNSGGQYTYMLEDERQWERMRGWFDHVAPTGDLRPHFAFNRFIETPGDRYTSYRVLASAHGNILAAGLTYSSHTKQDALVTAEHPEKKELELTLKGCAGTNYFSLLSATESPFYIAARKVTSNLFGGGSVIVLNPTEKSKQATDDEKHILEAHGIDPEDPRLPDDLVAPSIEIAKTIGRRRHPYVGIDFIQGGDETKYYLETNTGPGLEVYSCAKLGRPATDAEPYRMIWDEVVEEMIQANS